MMTMNTKGHYIGGLWVQGLGPQFVSTSPCTDEDIWTGNCATMEEVQMAVSAARSAFSMWSRLDVSERLQHLRSFVDTLKANKDELAECIASEIGKPRWEAATEVAAMIGKFEPTEASYGERNGGSSRPMGNGVSRTCFRPHGVVAVIGPYNFPGHMPNGHIMPALLAGNTVVFKPSELGSAVAELTVEYWDKAGLPAGVLNAIQGDGSVGQLLCQHPEVSAIFFTGSRRVGESIRVASPDKMCALEMGGNSPLIVWDASDIDAAVFAAVQSTFLTSGQRCSSARRLILKSGSFGDEFLSRLANTTRLIRVGRYTDDPQPYMGPLRTPSFVDQLLREQEHLIDQGAVPVLECRRLPLGRSFVTPGIVDVSSVHDREDKEIVGPLIQVTRISDFGAALEEANTSSYGLAAGLFSEDRSLYDRFQEVVKAGIVNWNQQLTGASAWAPFGGIKHSGNFRPSGYLAADYCVYSTGSIELDKLSLPNDLPPGFSFGESTEDGVPQSC